MRRGSVQLVNRTQTVFPRLPDAQPFYERLGATQVGELAAPVAGEERVLPVLRLVI